MTKNEFALFSAAIATYYPRENLFQNPQQMALWMRQMQDVPYDAACVALEKWVSLNKWSPTIADIREAVAEIGMGYVKDWSEAWKDVMDSMTRYGMRDYEKAYETYDACTLETVKRLGGFCDLCRSENIIADRANFRTIYESIVARKKSEVQMPKNVLEVLQQARYAIEGGTSD